VGVYDMMGSTWLVRTENGAIGCGSYVLIVDRRLIRVIDVDESRFLNGFYLQCRAFVETATAGPPEMTRLPPNRLLESNPLEFPELCIGVEEEVKVIRGGETKWLVRTKSGQLGCE
jgi:hypothetical protein